MNESIIRLLTAIIGLITAVLTIIKIRKTINMSNDFRAFKYTLNFFGTISIVIIFIYGLIFIIYSFPYLLSKISGNDRKNTTQQEIISLDVSSANNYMAFESIKLISSSTSRDAQLLLLIEKTLDSEEEELVVEIIDTISSSTEKSKAVGISINHYIKTDKLYLIPNIINFNPSSTDKEKNVILFLDALYKR
jgi:hypothetical protein